MCIRFSIAKAVIDAIRHAIPGPDKREPAIAGLLLRRPQPVRD